MKTLLIRSAVSTVCLIFFATALSAQRDFGPIDRSHHKIYRQDLDLGSFSNRASTVAPLPTNIVIQINDTVAYVNDVPYDQLQNTFATTFSFPRPDALTTALGDIRGINGKPAKGLYVNIAFPLLATPDPSPVNGISISDSTRIATVGQSFDLQTAEGEPIGGIFAWGFAFGPNVPGAPEGAGGGSIAIIGGTGPYIGVRGQMATTIDTSPVGENPSVRFASAAETTALRRINQGGVTKFVLQIFPTFSPDALMYDDLTPLVFHSGDESLVTVTNPATPGELLTVLARNLGPTNPQVFPGQPFPGNTAAAVNSPVDLQVNGTPVDVAQAVGTPLAVNVYDVTFVAPNGPSGINSAQIFVGYVGGVKFPLFIK